MMGGREGRGMGVREDGRNKRRYGGGTGREAEGRGGHTTVTGHIYQGKQRPQVTAAKCGTSEARTTDVLEGKGSGRE